MTGWQDQEHPLQPPSSPVAPDPGTRPHASAAERIDLRHFVVKLLGRLGVPHQFRPDGLLDAENPLDPARELSGPMARPQRLLLAFDEETAGRVEGAELLTPRSARFAEWVQLVRRRGRIIRLTALPTDPPADLALKPWLSLGLTLIPYAGGASEQRFDEWVINLVSGTAFPCTFSELEQRLLSAFGATQSRAQIPPSLVWHGGIPPEGSLIRRRRLSLRRAYRVICRHIVERAASGAPPWGEAARPLDTRDDVGKTGDGNGENGPCRPSTPVEVRARPYRAAILYLPITPRPLTPEPLTPRPLTPESFTPQWEIRPTVQPR